jgi:ATP-dependent helicase IRC3
MTAASTQPGASGSPFRLRDYQRQALDAIAQAEVRGLRRVLVVLPTGCGKTVVFAHLVAGRAGRALVVVHREELLDQAAGKLRLVAPGLDVGVVKAERDEVAARVVVASVQTLAVPGRLARARQAGAFTTIVVDEAHHAPAVTWRTRVLGALGALDAQEGSLPGGPLLVGFTATADRGDHVGLGSVFEQVVYERGLLDMIQAGYLVDLRAVRVGVAVDFRRLRVRQGDYTAGELGGALEAADAPELVAAAYAQHAHDRRGLVFTPTVELARQMTQALAARGITAEAVDGTSPPIERRAVLERLRDGQTRVVCNCALLTEGFDEPSISCVVVARPTRSRPLFTQMVGRGTRLHPGKTDCLVLDVVGVAGQHELVTAASLVGLAPDALDNGTTATRVLADRDRDTRPAAPAGGELVSVPLDLFARHRFHWVNAGGRFVLPTGPGQVILGPDPAQAGAWTVVERGRRRRELVARGVSLEDAQGIAEDLVRRSRAGALVDREAPWRHLPPTGRQLAQLARLAIPAPPGLTRGQASDLLTAHFASDQSTRPPRSQGAAP